MSNNPQFLLSVLSFIKCCSFSLGLQVWTADSPVQFAPFYSESVVGHMYQPFPSEMT